MIEGIIEKLKIQITLTGDHYIRISDTRKAKGACRWNFTDGRPEILLARSANHRTKLHEIGHAINLSLGNGKKYSDRIGMESEQFSDLVADILELCYSEKKEDRPKDAGV